MNKRHALADAVSIAARALRCMVRYQVCDGDFHIEFCGVAWTEAQALAKAFGTGAIDFGGPDAPREDTGPNDPRESTSPLVISDDGCQSCGWGSVIIIRGIIDGDDVGRTELDEQLNERPDE